MKSTFGYVIIFDLTQKKIKYPLYLNYRWSYKLLKRLANKKRHGQAVYKIFLSNIVKMQLSTKQHGDGCEQNSHLDMRRVNHHMHLRVYAAGPESSFYTL